MFNIVNQSGYTSYGVNKYLCDTTADFETLKSTETPIAGSTVFIAETGEGYIVNNKGAFIALPSGGGGSCECAWQFF